MNVAAPLWLLGLALVPLLLLARRAADGRARRYALRFPAADSLAAAVPPRGQWLQRLAAAALVLGLCLTAVALARPRILERVAVPDAELILVLDHSGSMAASDVQPTRIAAAIAAGRTLLSALPAGIRVGFVGFGSTPDAIQAPVSNRGVARRVLETQAAGGGTDTGPALEAALGLLGAQRRDHPPAEIVLLSDGAANRGVDPVSVARLARGEHVPIDTVALGTAGGVLYVDPFSAPLPVPPDPELMRQIAGASGGRSFDARTADQLSSIYAALGRRVVSRPHTVDLTVEVLVAAAVLLLGAVLARRLAPPVRV